MKKFVEFIAIVAALVWAVTSTVPSTEGKIREQLKDEGWQEIQLEQELDGTTWTFETKATEGEQTIVCRGTCRFDDEYGVIPTSMTVWGLEDGKLILLGTWEEGQEDIEYTAAADRYMRGTEISCEEAVIEE